MRPRTVRSLPKKTLWILLVLTLIAVALAVPLAAAASPSSSLSKAAEGMDSSSAATRAQFAMLAVTGLSLATATPGTPTFTDVPRTSEYYPYVEGASLSGLVRGLGGGIYGPDLSIARQQVATILARYLSAIEIETFGYIRGVSGTYATLAGWYAAEGQAQLAAFADWSTIAVVHRPGVAYLAMRGIALGADGWFNPLASVTVAQSVSFVARTADVARGFTTPAAATPTITALSPASGSYLGGTTVNIYGTGFASGATVLFGSTPATSVSVSSSTLIVAVSPAGAAGSTVNVSVTTTGGTSANTSGDDFTFSILGVPSITSLSASYGWAGDLLTIYGQNFSSYGLQVWFGSVQATASNVTYVSSTRIDVVVPSNTVGQTVNVRVVTAYGTSPDTSADNFTYYSSLVPTVVSLSSSYGWGGDVIQIYGTNFVSDDTAVYFGTEQVDPDYVTYYSTTRLTVVVPDGDPGDTVNVRVVTDYGTSPNTSADDFTYYYGSYAPSITGLSPDSGWAGETISIYGENFVHGDTTVYFGSQEADVAAFYGTTHITAVVPSGYSDGDVVRVKVVTDSGQSPNTSADDFTYVLSDDPVVSYLQPDTGWKGDVVYIHGHNFTAYGLKVWFGSVQVDDTMVTWLDSTKLKVYVPAGYDNGDVVSVTVATHYGTSDNTGADNFTYEAPGVGSVHVAAVQYSIHNADDWQSGHGATLDNGTYLDFRMLIVDANGDPVADTNVSGLAPRCSWSIQLHGGLTGYQLGHGGSSGPDIPVTDGDGYLYFSGLGGFSDVSYSFNLGLSDNRHMPFGQNPFGSGAGFTFSWTK